MKKFAYWLRCIRAAAILANGQEELAFRVDELEKENDRLSQEVAWLKIRWQEINEQMGKLDSNWIPF